MSIKKLPDGRYKVREVVRCPKTGRRLNLQATVATRAEAVERQREMRESAAGSRRKRLPLERYVRSWAEARAGTLKPSARRRYLYSFEHILPVLGEHFVDALTPRDVQKYVVERVKAGAAGNTVLNELRALRTVAKDSVADGVAARDWAARVKAPKVAKYTEEAPNLLTAEDLGVFLGALPPQWLRIAAFMATTGARWGEASCIDWSDIEVFEEAVAPRYRTPWDVVGEVKLRRSNYRGQAVTVKTESSYRAVPLVRFAAELLGKRPAEGGWVYPTRKGTLHRGTPLSHVFDRVFVRLGWCTWDKRGKKKHQFWKAVPIPGQPSKRITPHGLRRTWNDLGRQRGDRQIVQAITGHVTEAMTDHYSLIRRGEKAALSSAVARAALEPPKGEKP